MHEFERRLAKLRPVEPSVSVGQVMFDAGRKRGAEEARAGSAKAVVRWQLATALAVLIACGSVLPQVVPQKSDSLAEEHADAVSVPDPKQRESVANDSPADSPTRPGIRVESRWSILPSADQDKLAHRRFLLRRGIAGLTEANAASVGEHFVNSRQIRNRLLEEQGWHRP